MKTLKPSTSSIDPIIQNGITLLQNNPTDPRAQVLAEAAGCVLRDRNTDYGEPEHNFQNIVDLWNARLGIRLRTLGLKLLNAQGEEVSAAEFLLSHDVAVWMTDVKTARIEQSPTKRDHWSDGGGYNGCGYQAALKNQGGSMAKKGCRKK